MTNPALPMWPSSSATKSNPTAILPSAFAPPSTEHSSSIRPANFPSCAARLPLPAAAEGPFFILHPSAFILSPPPSIRFAQPFLLFANEQLMRFLKNSRNPLRERRSPAGQADLVGVELRRVGSGKP